MSSHRKHSLAVRRLRLEQLEARLVLSAQSWDLAADFAADFVGNLPQNNPNGPWSYYASDNTTTSLVATNGEATAPGPNTFGVGAGWAEGGGVPSYARGGFFGFPANSVGGHGTNKIVWTAPPEADLGAVEVSGLFTQGDFEPARQMRLKVIKNNAIETEIYNVETDFVNQTTVIPLPATQVAIEPGDTLTLTVDGTGFLGNGTSTFSAWNLNIQEIDPEIDADFSENYSVGEEDLPIWEAGFGTTLGATQQDGDADGNGAVTGADFLIWQTQLGNSVPSGEDPPGATGYHPFAIIVEPTGVTLPSGNPLNITGTQTQGLQEAFDHSAEQGYDIFILPGTYTLDAHLDLEELQLRTMRMEDVTLNFTSNVTDYGIRFDGTMMLDLYWKGGAINAPSATHGVLIEPRSPPPLDGPKLGIPPVVVDSRYHFAVDITGGIHDVTMNSSSGAISGTAFHFQNVPSTSINFVGGVHSDVIYTEGRTDDPIPFDLFSTAGRVSVIPALTDLSVGDPATVYKPDGTTLDVTGTQTTGLQEAFDYAAANDLDVVVFGRGIRNVAPFTGLSLYSLGTTLAIPDFTGRTIRIYAVTFDYPSSIIGGTTMSIGDMTNTDFEYTGQLVATNSNIGLHIQPDDTGITNSTIRVQTTVGSPAPTDSLIVLDSSLQTIEQSEFYFHEVNTAYFAVKVTNPSATTYFRDNYLRTPRIHGYRHIGLQLGESIPYAGRIRNNLVDVRTSSDGFPGEAAVQVWGDVNTINLVAPDGNQPFGVKFEPGSNNNILYHGTIQATTPIIDWGINNLVNPPLAALVSGLLGLPDQEPEQQESFSTVASRTEVLSKNEEQPYSQVSQLVYVPGHEALEARSGATDRHTDLPRDEVFDAIELEFNELEIL